MISIANTFFNCAMLPQLDGGQIKLFSQAYDSLPLIPAFCCRCEDFPSEIPSNLSAGIYPVSTLAQAKSAASKNPDFIMLDCCNAEILDFCRKENIPVIPLVDSLARLQSAALYQIDTVAIQSQGLQQDKDFMLSAAARLENISFVIFGIDPCLLSDYCEIANFCAASANHMFCDWSCVEGLTSEILSRSCEMLGFKLVHVGANCSDKEEAVSSAKKFAKLFGLDSRVGAVSAFGGTFVEYMMSHGLGLHGHIGLSVSSMERAVFHFKSRGIALNTASAFTDENGLLKLIYLQEEISGFAIHIMARGF